MNLYKPLAILLVLLLLGSSIGSPVLSNETTDLEDLDQDQDERPLHERVLEKVQDRIQAMNMSNLGQEISKMAKGLGEKVGLSSSVPDSDFTGRYSSEEFTTFETTDTSVPTRIWEIIRGGSIEYFNQTKKGGKWLEEFKRKVEEDEPTNWVIEIRGDLDQDITGKIEDIGASIIHKDYGIDALSIEAKPSKIENLLVSPSTLGLEDKIRIEAIWPDLYVTNNYYHEQIESNSETVDITGGVSSESVENASWNIDRVNANYLWSKKGNTGEDTVVAVVDTGVDKNHKMLENSTIETKNFVYSEPPGDLNGHGSHVASIVAGDPVPLMINNETTYISGVAPDTSILGIKVLGKYGGGSMTTVIKGLDYAVQRNKDHLDTPMIIVLSLGSPLAVGNTPMMDKVNRVVRRHKIPVVAAAGNTYIGINSPGTSEEAYTVASLTRNDEIATYSSKGPSTNVKDLLKPDISAPGHEIVGAKAGSTSQLVKLSGTSMAAPHVAGGMALLLSSDPTLEPDELKKVISRSADPLSGLDSLETWSGAGVLNVYAASETEEDHSSLEGFSNWINELFNLNFYQIIFMEEIKQYRSNKDLETGFLDLFSLYNGISLREVHFLSLNGGK